jgi:N-acetylmuramoyl-L-alanine amidase
MRLPRPLVQLTAALAAVSLTLLQASAAEAAPVPSAPLVAIDPGHGRRDVGAIGRVGEQMLVEKDLTLTVAGRTADLLEQAGYRVVLTRRDDAPADGGRDLTGDGRVDLADDLQARVDRANAAGAAVLLSIHFNGSPDRGLRGPEVYYSADRPFAAENRRLAEAVHAAIRARLREVGAPSTGRGILPDLSLGGGPLYLLGPAGGRIVRPSAMPGVLVEGLYLTNPDDARRLASPSALEALARAHADAVTSYLGPPTRRAIVTGPGGAHLRPSPLLATAPLALMPRGAPVDLAELADGDAVSGASAWWRVSWRGQAGFVFGGLVEPLPPARPAPAPAAPAGSPPPPAVRAAPAAAPAAGGTAPVGQAVVRDDGDGLAALLRGSPRRDAPVLIRARAGERLTVLESAEGEPVEARQATWLRVRRGNTIGWVWAPLLVAEGR